MAFVRLPFLMVLQVPGGSCSLLLRCQLSSLPQPRDRQKSSSLVHSAPAMSAVPLNWRFYTSYIWWRGKVLIPYQPGPTHSFTFIKGIIRQSVEPEATQRLFFWEYATLVAQLISTATFLHCFSFQWEWGCLEWEALWGICVALEQFLLTAI